VEVSVPTRPIPPDVVEKVVKLLKQKNLTYRDIAQKIGVSSGAVYNIAHKFSLNNDRSKIVVPEDPTEDTELQSLIQRCLKRNQVMSIEELSDKLDRSPKRIREAIQELKDRGSLLGHTVDGRVQILHSVVLEPGKSEVAGKPGDWSHVFGITGDNHLCNRNSRLDVLNDAYDHFEREGITTVYNTGNWIDGEARFNKNELVTAPGLDRQLDYMIDKWPQKPGIITHYIAGDDHEGWYQQREGIEVGRHLQHIAEEQGREDLRYLGYAEADICLKYGTGSSVLKILHPGGGSSYATSYTAQKIVESYQGGEKPQILFIGHYHKFEYGYPREVHCVQTGCTTDQSLFMRKHKIAAHVGFLTVKIKQADDGHVSRVAVEWFPYYDRGFYQANKYR
jgi:hypothetical protein